MSTSGVYTYDPAQIVLSCNGNAIGGYADGTIISLEREVAAYTKTVGADGVVSRAKQNNISGSLVITLQQTSPSNDVLSALQNQDFLSNDAIFTVVLRDVLGNTTMFSGQGWVESLPKTDFAKDISNREWTIHMSHMQFNVAGNFGSGTG